MTRSLHLCAAAVVAALALVSGPEVVGAQQVLNPMTGDYSIGSFGYSPPISDGWRELSKAPDGLEIVYVEQLADGRINSRAHLVFEASKVPVNAAVPSAEQLASLSRDQQIESRKQVLVGKTEVTKVPGSDSIYRYTLTTRGGEITLIEAFFIALAADRSEYIVAKLATREPDFENTPYFPDFYGSLASLKQPDPVASSQDAADDDDDDESDAEEGSGAVRADDSVPTGDDGEAP